MMLWHVIWSHWTEHNPLSIYQSLAVLEPRSTPPKLQLFGHATWPHRSYKPLQVDNPQLPSALQNARNPCWQKKTCNRWWNEMKHQTPPQQVENIVAQDSSGLCDFHPLRVKHFPNRVRCCEDPTKGTSLVTLQLPKRSTAMVIHQGEHRNTQAASLINRIKYIVSSSSNHV